jgi:hypothetical protein
MAVSERSLATMRRMLASTASGVPDLAEVRAAAGRGLSAEGARRWMTLPNRDLDGLTPTEAVTAGRGADALAAALAMVFADAS